MEKRTCEVFSVERIDEIRTKTREVRGVARDEREAVGQSGCRNLLVDRVLRMRNAQTAPYFGLVVQKSRM